MEIEPTPEIMDAAKTQMESSEKYEKVKVSKLPTPLKSRFIIENPVEKLTSNLILPPNTSESEYYQKQMEKFNKVKVIKMAKIESNLFYRIFKFLRKKESFKEGDIVKLMPGRYGEALFGGAYITYYQHDVSHVW